MTWCILELEVAIFTSHFNSSKKQDNQHIKSNNRNTKTSNKKLERNWTLTNSNRHMKMSPTSLIISEMQNDYAIPYHTRESVFCIMTNTGAKEIVQWVAYVSKQSKTIQDKNNQCWKMRVDR